MNLDGITVQLSNVYHDGHISTKAAHFIGTAPDGSKLRGLWRPAPAPRRRKLHLHGGGGISRPTNQAGAIP